MLLLGKRAKVEKLEEGNLTALEDSEGIVALGKVTRFAEVLWVMGL